MATKTKKPKSAPKTKKGKPFTGSLSEKKARISKKTPPAPKPKVDSKAGVRPAKRSRRRTTGEWCDLFLASLRLAGNVRRACLSAGISREEAYNHRERDADFAKAWDDARQEAVDVLEEQAFRRSTVGYQDKDRGLNVPPSDSLLRFLLQAHGGEKYRNNVKLSGDVAAPLIVEAKVDGKHEHAIHIDAIESLRRDLLAAGVGGLPPVGEAQPLDQKGSPS